MRFSWLVGPLALTAALGSVCAQAELKYRVQDLGTLQGGILEDVYARGLNNAGVVVGTSIYDPGTSKIGAFVWEQGRMRALVPITTWDLGYSAAVVNDQGVIAGEFFSRRVRGPSRPVLFRDGGWVDIGVVPGHSQTARVRDINEAGEVVGHDNDQAFIFDGTTSRRLPLTGNTEISEAVAINDHGLVAGINYLGGYNFLYDSRRDTLARLPLDIDANTSFMPIALNNAGQLLGEGRISGPSGLESIQPYIYEDGRYRSLAGGDPFILPTALNDQGWVVGNYVATDSTPPLHAFLWRDGVRSDLNDLMVPPRAGVRWELVAATDINERGQIIGYGRIDGGTSLRSYIATPVPEAGTGMLMLAGLALLGGWARCGAGARGARPAWPAQARAAA